MSRDREESIEKVLRASSPDRTNDDPGWRLGSGAEPQFLELAVERGEAQAEPARRLALVVVAIPEDALDMLALVVPDGQAEAYGLPDGQAEGADQ